MGGDEKMSVKVKEINKRQRKAADVLNKLPDVMLQRNSKKGMGKIIDDLIEYHDVLFKREKSYFDKFRAPEAEAHKKEKRDFAQKVVCLKGYDEGGIMLSVDEMNFLKYWLFKHTMGSKQRYSAFFKKHGLNQYSGYFFIKNRMNSVWI